MIDMDTRKSKQRFSNYEIMRDRMEVEFAKYDQDTMIRKFGLKNDAEHIFYSVRGAGLPD